MVLRQQWSSRPPHLYPILALVPEEERAFDSWLEVANYKKMRFGLADSSGLLQAFVLPATAPARSSWCHRRPTRAFSSLCGDTRSRALEAKWPWIFEQPSRCTDLPAEEIFSGFEGLPLLDDELNDMNNQDDGTYNSNVRLACAVCRIRYDCRITVTKTAKHCSLLKTNNQGGRTQAHTYVVQQIDSKFEILAVAHV